MTIWFQEWNIRRKLGNSQLVILIDPRQIDTHAEDRPRKRWRLRINLEQNLPRAVRRTLNTLMWQFQPFAIGPERLTLSPLNEMPTYKIMKDIWDNRDTLTNSDAYARALKSLRETGHYNHKFYVITREDQIEEMLRACYLDILSSMATQGYVMGKEVAHATGGMGNCVIGRNGEIYHEAAATHRLMAARIVGLDHGFPMRVIAADREWLAEQGIAGIADIAKLPKALQSLKAIAP